MKISDLKYRRGGPQRKVTFNEKELRISIDLKDDYHVRYIKDDVDLPGGPYISMDDYFIIDDKEYKVVKSVLKEYKLLLYLKLKDEE